MAICWTTTLAQQCKHVQLHFSTPGGTFRRNWVYETEMKLRWNQSFGLNFDFEWTIFPVMDHFWKRNAKNTSKFMWFLEATDSPRFAPNWKQHLAGDGESGRIQNLQHPCNKAYSYALRVLKILIFQWCLPTYNVHWDNRMWTIWLPKTYFWCIQICNV